MRKETKEIVKLTARQVLLTLFDIPLGVLYAFDARGYYRKSMNEYFAERSFDRSNFSQSISRLRRMGYINAYLEGSERYFELTTKGFEKIAWEQFNRLSIERPDKWDGLFRIVIFDVPQDKSDLRDLLRRKLLKLGFKLIQKSVFAYPFECKKEIEQISYNFSVSRYLKYMIAEIIEGEDEIISSFLDSGVLKLADLDR